MRKRILCFILVIVAMFSCCALSAAAAAETGSAAKQSTQLTTPKITSVSGGAGSVKISWDKVSGAAKYRVFYKTSSGWKKIADTTSASYTWADAKAGTSYTFTVRCVSADGKAFTSGYSTTGTTYTVPLATPKITGVSGGAGSVKISWGKITGAAKYRVFYKTSSGWKKIADTTSTSYTWTGAAAGTSYTFTVRCVSANGKTFTSNYDAKGKSYKVPLATPKISSVSGGADSVKISWGKVTGAAKYRVFYKTGSGGWKKIADTTSTSYTWTGAKAGTKYTFTVRCVSADGKTFTSDYDAAGKTYQVQLAAPKLSSVVGSSDGVKISWGKVSGAAKYRVFYKTGSGGWKKIADTTSTSYTWKGAKEGAKYTFTVRCVSADGKTFTSGYDTAGKAITYAAAPKLSSVSKVSTGIKISWSKATGAANYRVFYKTPGGSWTQLADTTSTSYTWTGPQDAMTYTFTVRCVTADGSAYTSGYDTAGKKITYYKVDTPQGFKAAYSNGDVKLTWNSVSNAEYYIVVYRVGSYDVDAEDWEAIDWTFSTYMYCEGARRGTKYTFVVVAVDEDGYMSDYAHCTYTHK